MSCSSQNDIECFSLRNSFHYILHIYNTVKPNAVRLENLFLFCYRCTFLKRCDRLRSVPFYYRSPFRFFCCLHLNGAVLPLFLGTCNTYVRTTFIDVTLIKLSLVVGSLVSLLARSCRCWLARVAMPKAYSD